MKKNVVVSLAVALLSLVAQVNACPIKIENDYQVDAEGQKYKGDVFVIDPNSQRAVHVSARRPLYPNRPMVINPVIQDSSRNSKNETLDIYVEDKKVRRQQQTAYHYKYQLVEKECDKRVTTLNMSRIEDMVDRPNDRFKVNAIQPEGRQVKRAVSFTITNDREYSVFVLDTLGEEGRYLEGHDITAASKAVLNAVVNNGNKAILDIYVEKEADNDRFYRRYRLELAAGKYNFNMSEINALMDPKNPKAKGITAQEFDENRLGKEDFMEMEKSQGQKYVAKEGKMKKHHKTHKKASRTSRTHAQAPAAAGEEKAMHPCEQMPESQQEQCFYEEEVATGVQD